MLERLSHLRALLAGLGLAGLGLAGLAGASATAPSAEEVEAWFDAPGAGAVNEGDLVFLTRRPDRPVHTQSNDIVISEQSLADGWVRLRQCHEHLDQVSRTQIVFRPGRVRDLKVESSRQVAKAWVEGASVQLQDIGPAARVCLSAQSRALETQPDASLVLQNGPFMRRFLDGYYPMHVSLRVRMDAPTLRFTGLTPAPRAGFELTQDGREVRWEAWFEGRLVTRMRFERVAPGADGPQARLPETRFPETAAAGRRAEPARGGATPYASVPGGAAPDTYMPDAYM